MGNVKSQPGFTPRLVIIALLLFGLKGLTLGEEVILLKKDQGSPSSWLWVTTIAFGEWSGWSQDGNTGRYVVCDLQKTATNETNSWLVSEYIDLHGANEIHVNIKFTSRKCANLHPYYRESFEVYEYQTNSPVHGGITKDHVNAGNFKFVGEINATDPWQNTPLINEANVTFEVNSKGVYIAFKDEGSCTALTSITVFSKYCPDVVDHGVVFAKTAAPSASQHRVEVTGNCSNGASPSPNNIVLNLVCLHSGQWVESSTVKCFCNAGYELVENTCKRCASGHYKKDTGNGKCLPCPANSRSNSAQNSCPCENGFYRAPQDDIYESCTAPPSEPRNITITVVTDSVIMVAWSSPAIKGGRSDVKYDLQCSACSRVGDCYANCPLAQFWPSKVGLGTPQVTVSNLNSLFVYNISVISKNGVSDRAGPESLLSSFKTFAFPQATTTPTKVAASVATNQTATVNVNQPKEEEVLNVQSTSNSQVAKAIGISVTVTFVLCVIIAVLLITFLMKSWKKTHDAKDIDISSDLSSQTHLTELPRSVGSAKRFTPETMATELNNDFPDFHSIVEEDVEPRKRIPSISVESSNDLERPASTNSSHTPRTKEKAFLSTLGWVPPRSITPILLPRKNNNSVKNSANKESPTPSETSLADPFTFSKPQGSLSFNSWFPAEEIQYNV